MAWQAEDRHCYFRWILKCPFLLPYLGELNNAFPDSTIIWMHRHPAECVASACSLYEIMLDMTINTWTLDRNALGRAVLNYTELQLEKANEIISKLGKRLNIIHLPYTKLIDDPCGTVKAVCKKVNCTILFSL